MNNKRTSNGVTIGTLPQVSIERCLKYDCEKLPSIIEACVERIGGFPKFLGSAKRILLKPNLLSASNPNLAITTNPLFIESIIKIIKKTADPQAAITIADSPGVSTPHTRKDLKKLYDECGISYLDGLDRVNLSLETDYSIISFKEGAVLKQLEVIKPVIDADLIINLPKFKTHSLTGITGAVKNMFGIIYGRTKTMLHTKFIDTDKFNNMLLDIYSFKKPVLNIMDGITGLEGEGPGARGNPRNTGLILASSDALALDCIMAAIMGFESENIPLLKCAKARGFTGWQKETIDLYGGDLPEFIIKDYKLPKESPLDRISTNRFLNAYLFPFIRNSLSLSPCQDIKKCTMCNTCIEICPEKAIRQNSDRLIFDYKKCIRCFCCSEMCLYGAIDLKYSFIGNLLFGRKNKRHKT